MSKNSIKILSFLFLNLSLCLSIFAADADELQGKWKANREIDGNKVTFNLDIEKESFKFEIKDANGDIQMFVKGNIKVETQGEFKTLLLRDMEGGQSENDLQSIDDPRSFVYITGWKTLTLASNFDRQRDNEEAELTVYRKQ